MIHKWDVRFLNLCGHISDWSKDPSTKVGAVIVRPDRTIASVGYNGFPRGVIDRSEMLQNREQKYPRVVHAELNAILNAREPLVSCVLYVSPISPCSTCCGAIIQSGIRRVVAVMSASAQKTWSDQARVSEQMFKEAGVTLEVHQEEELLDANA